MAKKKSSPRSRRPAGKKQASSLATGERINKVLAAAGFGSRREVEELVVQGRVEVDRETITNLSTRVDPSKQKIKVDGIPLKKQKLVYFALNKPPGVLSTNRDPSGRLRVIDFVPDSERVFSVGRLDRSSEGLILLTNDGSLAQRLAHPKYRIQKSYFVVVAGTMTNDELVRLRKGVHLAEGFARIDGARIRRHRKGCTELEIVLSEGKNREIRRILARAGHKVVLLRRIGIGTLRLGLLPIGASRPLTATEVKSLYALATPAKKPAKKAKPSGSKTSGNKGPKPSKADNSEQPHEFLDDEFVSQDFTDDEFISQDFGSDSFDEAEFEGVLPPLGDSPEAEFEYDDDFVANFDASGAQGSVIGAEEEEAPRRSTGRSGGKKSGSTRKTASGSRTRSTPNKRSTSGAGRSSAARGSRTQTSSGSRATASSRPATKKKSSTKRASSNPRSSSSAGSSKRPSRSAPTAGSGRGGKGKPAGGRSTKGRSAAAKPGKRQSGQGPKGKRR